MNCAGGGEGTEREGSFLLKKKKKNVPSERKQNLPEKALGGKKEGQRIFSSKGGGTGTATAAGGGK